MLPMRAASLEEPRTNAAAMKAVNKTKSTAAFGLDQSTVSQPKAFVNDISTAVSVIPCGRGSVVIVASLPRPTKRYYEELR